MGERPPISALIVDDEPLARQAVRGLLATDPEIEVLGECADGASAVREIRRLRPALVFLDIQMPGMDGFAVLRELRDSDEGADLPRILFVTAYDRYALRAFEAHALDYLLKPFSRERFHGAVAQAKKEIRRDEWSRLGRRLAALVADLDRPGAAARETAFEETETATEADGEAPLSRIMVKSVGRVKFVAVEEIDWIEAADYYSRLHTGGQTHLVRQTMKSLAARLDPERFCRIHRSAIVNLERVAEVRRRSRGRFEVVLRDGTAIELSRSRRADLVRRLAGFSSPSGAAIEG